MALLDEKNLAAEAAKRARFRVHHVGTKLNEAELHELEDRIKRLVGLSRQLHQYDQAAVYSGRSVSL